jgi:hypothetical protein
LFLQKRLVSGHGVVENILCLENISLISFSSIANIPIGYHA